MRAARRGRRALPGGTPGRNAAGTGAWCSRGIRGRGRRPRRPASWRRPRGRPDGVPCARRAEDVAPYHGCAYGVRVRTWHALADMARGVVGADVLGGPRARGRPRCRSVGAARRGRCALPWVRAWRACADVACVGGHGAGRGRGRRPRRPARPWASPMSSPMASRGQRRAGDVAPDQVRAWRACADVACVGGHGAGRGRGRRPRRPARPWASSMARPWASSGRVAWLRPYGGLDILPAQHACPVV